VATTHRPAAFVPAPAAFVPATPIAISGGFGGAVLVDRGRAGFVATDPFLPRRTDVAMDQFGNLALVDDIPTTVGIPGLGVMGVGRAPFVFHPGYPF
jgi:hypothetical protein